MKDKIQEAIRNKTRELVIEEVARIALEDREYRHHLSPELSITEEQMEDAYQHLCQLVRDEGGEPE